MTKPSKAGVGNLNFSAPQPLIDAVKAEADRVDMSTAGFISSILDGVLRTGMTLRMLDHAQVETKRRHTGRGLHWRSVARGHWRATRNGVAYDLTKEGTMPSKANRNPWILHTPKGEIKCTWLASEAKREAARLIEAQP